jgi:hypothetical protein
MKTCKTAPGLTESAVQWLWQSWERALLKSNGEQLERPYSVTIPFCFYLNSIPLSFFYFFCAFFSYFFLSIFLLTLFMPSVFVLFFVLYLSFYSYVLCFVDRASRYIRIMKTNLRHYLSSVYFFIQLLHVSGVFVAHHHIYTTICKWCAF